MLNTIDLEEKYSINLNEMYDKVDGTKNIVVDDEGGIISFTKQFIYLDSVINYLIDNIVDT